MTSHASSIKTFRDLHIPGNPIVLYNIWDAGSAKAVGDAGAKALATGSAPVAMAQGFTDGEQIPFDLALANIERILNATNIPVTMDLEGGYGADSTTIESTVEQAIATGIVGFNFEDQIVGGKGLYDTVTQTDRLSSARKAADSVISSTFINARTDIFLKQEPDTHTTAMLNEAIERAHAYEQAGADGFFAPGLADEKFIETLCEQVNLPVNIIALPHVPDKAKLIELGVSRISYGPVPYKKMLKVLAQWASDELA
ncbi:MAG: isocitrate lyase/phosphoenolpyruvate mutase family protein [Granulosicoccaceae bacterium]